MRFGETFVRALFENLTDLFDVSIFLDRDFLGITFYFGFQFLSFFKNTRQKMIFTKVAANFLRNRMSYCPQNLVTVYGSLKFFCSVRKIGRREIMG